MGLKPPRSLQRGLCPRVTAGALHLAYLSAIVASNGGEELDLRVSKAMHMRGYGKVRISVVDHGSADYRGFFDYEAPFAHRWTGLHLHSVVEKVPSNGTAVFDIGGRRVEVRLPAEGHRSRGLLFADPCIISSRDWNCTTADRFRTFDRLVDVVNTVVGSNEIDYWGILGDNFYESRSPIGQIFFSQVSLRAKAKPFLSVPGNHDFWMSGHPPGKPWDQFGNGFMQYYGQDTEAALRSGGATPFDFSASPEEQQIPRLENFVFSHQIGDVGFFGYSGAHRWTELKPFTERFCRWANSTTTIRTVVVLGHWQRDDGGCIDTSAPNVWSAIRQQHECGDKLVLFVDGHTHCNLVTEPERGFMVGANGMGPGLGCEPQFGFIVLESGSAEINGRAYARVDYFEIANDTADNWGTLYRCLRMSGYTGCRDLYAQPWLAPEQQPQLQQQLPQQKQLLQPQPQLEVSQAFWASHWSSFLVNMLSIACFSFVGIGTMMSINWLRGAHSRSVPFLSDPLLQ